MVKFAEDNADSAKDASEKDAANQKHHRGTVVAPRKRGTPVGDIMKPKIQLVCPAKQANEQGGFLDETGKPVSKEDKVADRIKFRQRNSIFRQIAFDGALEPEKTEGPAKTEGPVKGAMKKYNRGSIKVDMMVLTGEDAVKEYEHTEIEKDEFLMNYGLSRVMIDNIKSLCTTTHHLRVLIDNSSSIKEKDGKSIQGKNLPDDARLKNTVIQYEVSLEKCERYVEIQDICYFLVEMAATTALPATFELFSKPTELGGTGRGVRKIGSTNAGDPAKMTAEDYIPLGEQVQSAIGMIEDLPELNISSIKELPEDDSEIDCSVLHMIRNFKAEALEVKGMGKKLLVLIMTSLYPWGEIGSERDVPRLTKEFIEFINKFANLPITFLFLVESTDAKIVAFYDGLLSPESGVTANIKIAKGLGLMISGVSKHNPWLNYCLPFHVCQVLGFCTNVLSQAASRPLKAAEVRELCNSLVGGNVPDPKVDMNAFYSSIKSLMEVEAHTMWNPVTGKGDPIVDVEKLKKHLHNALLPVLLAILVAFVAVLVARFK